MSGSVRSGPTWARGVAVYATGPLAGTPRASVGPRRTKRSTPRPSRLRSLAQLPARCITLLAFLACVHPCTAQEPGDAPPVHRELDEPWGGDSGEFFKGALLGFGAHEAGHLIANAIEGTDFGLQRVDFGPIPFFTIQPGKPQTNREHYLTAQAGFTAQHLVNEWLLETHPDLRNEREPFLQGVATFNFWLGVGYSATGLLGYGPDERDTRGMADSLGWSEESVSLMILAPTLLDYHRYKHPEDKWARDLSRIAKLAILGLALTADD